MKDTILTKNEEIWPQLTAAVKRAKHPCWAAVAYMGQNGAKMLPLPKGSKLIVDASKGAVKSGQTDPRELSKLYNKKVEVYSLSGLHAKVIVTDSSVFIGSANVSQRSAKHLTEAVLMSNNKAVKKQAIDFIEGLPAKLLGPRELSMLEQLYEEPDHVPQASEQEGNQERTEEVYVYFLDWDDVYDESAEKIVAKGKIKAEKKFKKARTHVLDEFQWDGKSVPREGDVVVHIMREHDKLYIYPPGTVLHVERDPLKLRRFIWSEILNIEGVPFNELPKSHQNAIGLRSGKRNSLDVVGLQNELKKLVK